MSCVKKYVKCPDKKTCRVKTGNCVLRQPYDDVAYRYQGKDFFITPGKGHKRLIQQEYSEGRQTRQTSIMRKIAVLDKSIQKDLINASDKEFEITLHDLDQAAEFLFPEVPFQASPTGMSKEEKSLLRRIRGLDHPLGAPPELFPMPRRYTKPRGRDVELDVRRLSLFNFQD